MVLRCKRIFKPKQTFSKFNFYSSTEIKKSSVEKKLYYKHNSVFNTKPTKLVLLLKATNV